MRLRLLGSIALIILCLPFGRMPNAVGQQLSPITVPLTVREPAAVARTNGTVTSGVPLPTGTTETSWALFDGATEIPVQTRLLPGIRTPWVLVDFQTSLTANEAKTYELRAQAPTAVSSTPISITENASTATITTGPLRVAISKTTYNLLDDAWLDRDGNFTFDESEHIITATTNDNLPLITGTTSGSIPGAVLTGRGTPTSLSWETSGPLRSVLKVDGEYINNGTPFIHFTDRLTFTAGSAVVRIERVLRNSYALEERYVKVQSSKLILGGNGATVRASTSGSYLWTTVSASGATSEIIPATLDMSTTYDPNATPYVNRQNTTTNVDTSGGMIIGDWSYHGATTVFDFTEGLTAPEKSQRATASSDRLVALAPASWYSDMGAFGAEKFGTYDDEIATYANWGWQWPTPGNPYSAAPLIGRMKATYRADWNRTDAGDLEADDLWMNLLMYVRTGSRGYLDRTDAMARYYKWELSWRTDGFEYMRKEYWCGPSQPTTFPANNLPAGSFTAADTQYIDYNIKYYGKSAGDHSWNAGLIDYYYMFGDMDALQAAIDTAEQSRQHTIWRVPGGNGVVGGNPRGEARELLNTLRVWEATNVSQWKTAADHLRDMFMHPNSYYDSRGFYYGLTNETATYNINTRFPNAKYFAGFMLGVTTQAFYRYWLLTNDAAVRTRMIQMADFALAHGTNDQGYTGDNTIIDYPQTGAILHLSYDQFRKSSPLTLYPYSSSTGAFIDTLTIAYRLTGQSAYLAKARSMWGKMTKRLGVNSYTTLIADDTHVGRFMNSLLNIPTSTLYPENGDLMTSMLLFYDTARMDSVAPASTTTLIAQ